MKKIQATGFILVLFIMFFGAQAQEKDDKWEVSDPPGPAKEVEITVSEGTWMNLDVSPDGQTLVFDLLGDIFLLPIEGGEATLLRGGHPWECQPRFSPDGQHIAFTSDAGGGDNIWVMDADGQNARQVTKEDFRLLNNPAWTPDGQYLVARKHFTSTRSLGAGEIWMYHLSGGDGIQLTKRKNDQQDVNEPCVSSDGRYVFFSEDMYPGGYFQYNKDPNSQIYVIRRYDLQKGEIENITGGPGGAIRPQISHSGKHLAFVRRVRTQSILFVRDLDTGEEWPIFDGLSKDQQEAWAIFGAYTGFDWTPDDQYIIIWGLGKLWKVDVSNQSAEEIPFTATSAHQIAEALHFRNEPFTKDLEVKVIRHAITSPDGKLLVFSAVGSLWAKKLPRGKPYRLTEDAHFEFEPSFSPDGQSIVYVSWDDEARGAIWKLGLAKGDEPVKLTDAIAIYRTPCFSPDGQHLVYRKEEGNMHLGMAFSENPGIYLMSADGGDSRRICTEGERPQFNSAGDRIFYQTGGDVFGSLEKSFKSVNLQGEDERTHFTSKYASHFVPSPDNRWIAFNELFKVYVAAMPMTGKPVEISAQTKSIPVAQVAKDAGINLHWSGDGQNLHWTLGGDYFSRPLTETFAFVSGAPDSLPPMDTVGLPVNLVVESDRPEGLIAFTNARIITMKGDEVIENGTLLVEGNLIKAIGPSEEVEVPKKSTVIDCTGKTIIPGLVDAHAHVEHFRLGLNPQKHWPYYANLAYGVTSTHDPSANTEMVFAQSELVQTGRMVGPRVFSTGIILYGAEGDFRAVINSLEDARSAIRRTKAFGAFSVKSYNQPRREQRQMVITAAREQEIEVMPEGGSFFYHNMSMILDGHTGIEHNIPIYPAYDDVVQLWSNSKTAYTPTLIVNYGSINGEYYFYQHTNVWEKERLLTFTPRGVVDARSRHRTMVPEEEYAEGHIKSAELCKTLTDAGVKVNMGAHGQLQGLGAHWEMWMLAQGGMTPLEAIRASTLNPAQYIGMGHAIGSLEPGKLADLAILDANPLEDIRNSEYVTHTMINGRLFDASTMNEIGNYDRPRSKFFWESEKYGRNFPFHMETRSFSQPGCGCGRH